MPDPESLRRRTHLCGVVACVFFALVVALALLRPGRYAVGPVVIRLNSLSNPLAELGAALLVTLATAKRTGRFRLKASRRLLGLWSGWTTGGRIFAVALAAKLAMTAVNVARLPGQYLTFHQEARSRLDAPLETAFARGNRYAQFERFFESCRQQLPDDARVIYFGRGEGQLLAYILYPRPVFMHPTDRYVAWVGHQVLDLGRELPNDELFPGGLPLPLDAPSLEEFVSAHRITHEVRFVESDLPACRIRAIR